jgi:hypothetical protein
MEDRLYGNKRLDEWFRIQPPNAFPGGRNYVARLDSICDYLAHSVYPDVEKGAMVAAQEEGGESILLTDHGKKHVEQVISRATDILRESQCRITPYEGYLLLAAIYLHDVGNIYGRKNHERKCNEILQHLGTAAGDDSAERRLLARISSAHGGTRNGDADTIGALQSHFPILGHSVRKQFLAALLRFSDELADDRTRASRFLLENNRLPARSKLYHTYSNALRSVEVGERDVKLHFELSTLTASQKYPKDGSSVFLLDEIFARTMKTHVERIYCMRFMRSDIRIDRIFVKIEVFDQDFIQELREPVSYCLEELGYPSFPRGGIHDLCPHLHGITGETLMAELLSKRS